MAKCIKMHDGPLAGRVIRLPDKYARELVDEGRAEYKPKTEWKTNVSGESRLQPKGRV